MYIFLQCPSYGTVSIQKRIVLKAGHWGLGEKSPTAVDEFSPTCPLFSSGWDAPFIRVKDNRDLLVDDRDLLENDRDLLDKRSELLDEGRDLLDDDRDLLEDDRDLLDEGRDPLDEGRDLLEDDRDRETKVTV